MTDFPGQAGVSADTALGDTIRDVTMTQPSPAPPPARTRTWPIAALAILAVVLAAAALIVALTRSEAGSSPTYKAEAKEGLCNQYKLASQAVGIETNATDNVALARISDTNGAVILWAASIDPALGSKYRNAAQDLALAYQTVVAISSSKAVDDPQFRATIDDSYAKGRVMRGLCGD